METSAPQEQTNTERENEIEQQEWIDSIESVIRLEGFERAK